MTAPLLDAPCGYGRHLERFAERGFTAVGLDACAEFVEAARLRLSSRGLIGDVQVGELVNLPFKDASFGAVVNLFFSFGFYNHEGENEKCMREFFRVLAPGGKLLIHTDVNVPLIALGRYRQPTHRWLEDGSRLHIRENMNWSLGRLVGSWKISDSEGVLERRYSMRVYTAEEWVGLCQKVGFKTVNVFGSFDEADQQYSEHSEELIIVAGKE